MDHSLSSARTADGRIRQRAGLRSSSLRTGESSRNREPNGVSRTLV